MNVFARKSHLYSMIPHDNASALAKPVLRVHGIRLSARPIREDEVGVAHGAGGSRRREQSTRMSTKAAKSAIDATLFGVRRVAVPWNNLSP